MNSSQSLLETKNRFLSRKWAALDENNMLPFWVADMEFNPPAKISNKILDIVTHYNYGGYSNITKNFLNSFCSYVKRLHNWDISPDQLIVKMAMVPFLNLVTRTIAKKGEKVVVLKPAYYHLFNAPNWGGQQTILIPLKIQDNQYILDFELLEKHFKIGVKLFIFCNPQNPSGKIWNRVELEKIVNLCEKYDVLICSDEIHSDLIIDQEFKHIPIASVSDQAAKRTITLMSTSKTYNIPDFGATFCIVANPSLHKMIADAARGILADISILGLSATEIALTECEDWRQSLLKTLFENRKLLKESIDTNKNLNYMWPQNATYLAWIAYSGIGEEELEKRAIANKIKISNGSQFEGLGFLRFNFATSKDMLNEGIARLLKCFS